MGSKLKHNYPFDITFTAGEYSTNSVIPLKVSKFFAILEHQGKLTVLTGLRLKEKT